MSKLTSQEISIWQKPFLTQNAVLNLQFGTSSGQKHSQLSPKESALNCDELDRAENAPQSVFFLLLRAKFEKSAGHHIHR
jgi:hypothetical protein